MPAPTPNLAPSPDPRPDANRIHDVLSAGRQTVECAGVGFLALVVFFFHLGSYGLWEPDEARYAEIAREMLSTGNLLVPHLNYVAYIEKPPLLYWMTALAFHFLGANEFAARLVPALSALGGVIATYWFGRRAFDHRRGLLAAAILTTSPVYAAMAQVVITDMLLTALLSIAFFTLFLQWREGGRWWLAMYAAAALAMLTKGPVGVVLPAVAGLLFLWRQGELRIGLKRFHLAAGALIIAAAALPWFVAVAVRQPGFMDFYFYREHFRRVFVATYSHGEPFYFYLPVILLGMIPWSICLPLIVTDGTRGPARSFCTIVAGTVVLLFSAANAKLIPYVLPALPPLAILLADSIFCAIARPAVGSASWRIRRASLVTAIGPALCAGGVACIAVALVASRIPNRDLVLLGPVLFAIGVIVLAGGAGASAALRRARTWTGLALVAVTVSGAMLAGSYGRIRVECLHSYAALSRELALQAPGSTLIDYHRYPQAIPFYTRKRVVLAGPFRSELRFGAEHSPGAAQFFPETDAELLSLWAKDPSPVLVIDEADLQHLKAGLGPVRVIASQGHKLAIAKVLPRKGQGPV
jgi:4-amino-4-deoxy-L-arabinose transferase-like glycosyltransferase